MILPRLKTRCRRRRELCEKEMILFALPTSVEGEKNCYGVRVGSEIEFAAPQCSMLIVIMIIIKVRF